MKNKCHFGEEPVDRRARCRQVACRWSAVERLATGGSGIAVWAHFVRPAIAQHGRRAMRLALWGLAAVFVLAACTPRGGGAPAPGPWVPPPVEPVSQDSILLAGKYYLPRVLQYYDGFYPAVGEDCVVLHLEFIIDGKNTGAGMTVEISRELLGRTIEFAPSDKFWFFHVGTGSAYAMLQNDKAQEKYSGRFKVDLGAEPDRILFEWTLIGEEGTLSEGTLDEPFERLTTL